MSVMMEEPPVAEKKKRRYVVAKIDVDAISMAKKVAALKGVTLADYLSDVVFPIASRELQAEAKKISKCDKTKRSDDLD